MTVNKVSLNDRFDIEKKIVIASGTQALVRLMLNQAARDKIDGINSAGLVTGYRGSPLGGVDATFTKAENFLKKLAMEYASVPIPFDIPDRINPKTGEGLKKGDSYYEGRSGNTTKNNPKTVEDYLEILMDFSRTGSDI